MLLFLLSELNAKTTVFRNCMCDRNKYVVITVCQHIKYSDVCDEFGSEENIRTYICYHVIFLFKILPQSMTHCRRIFVCAFDLQFC